MHADYSEERNIFGCVASDSRMYFWINEMNLRFFKTINAPAIQTGIWYLKHHDCWVSGGKDNVLRQWNIEAKGSTHSQEQTFTEHGGEIMDVVEIQEPFCIAVASYNDIDRGVIMLYNLVDKCSIGKLVEHKTHVRRLCYNQKFGGTLLSIGSENYINVWTPNVSITRAHSGKLFGHSIPVVDAKFIHTTPFIASVDFKLNVRLWDQRNLSCLQIISYDQKAKLPCQGILTFNDSK